MFGTGLKKWVKRLQAGDQSAFLPLYETTAPGLLRFLLWKTQGDRALSEDILQEAFVRFLVSLDQLEAERDLSVQSYLFHTVKNCWIDKVVRSPHAKRTQVPLEAVAHLADPAATHKAERAVELRELRIAMQALEERDSEIIWLRDALGYSHKEVADHVGISEQATRQAYIRAKKSLLSICARMAGPSPEGQLCPA